MKRLLISFFLLFFVQNLFVLSAGVQMATDIVRVFASSEKGDNPAKNAFDGNPATRWESEWGIDPSWIAVKLKAKRIIKALKIKWEAAAASVYQIEVSNDGKKWKKVARIEDGQGNDERVIKFKKIVRTRYLRIHGEQRTMDEYGYSIWEVKLNPIVLSDLKKVEVKRAEASSVQSKDVPENMDLSASMAIDGNMDTRWASEWEDPQWLVLELEKKTKIRVIKIKWETASAKVYNIQVSNDKKSWKEVATIDNGTPNQERIISFKPIKAKYVRIYGKERNGDWGYSIRGVEIYK